MLIWKYHELIFFPIYWLACCIHKKSGKFNYFYENEKERLLFC